MAVEKLKCKECGTGYPLDALYVCERCFGPLEVAYNHDDLGDAAEIRRRIQAGRSDLWRYADFLPLVGGPPGPSNPLASRTGLPAGGTPLVPSWLGTGGGDGTAPDAGDPNDAPTNGSAPTVPPVPPERPPIPNSSTGSWRWPSLKQPLSDTFIGAR